MKTRRVVGGKEEGKKGGEEKEKEDLFLPSS